MTPHEIRDLLARRGLTQTWLGETLAGHATTGRRWCAGVSAAPPAAVILLRLLDRGEVDIEDIEKHAKWLKAKAEA